MTDLRSASLARRLPWLPFAVAAVVAIFAAVRAQAIHPAKWQHTTEADFQPGETGLICSFGAGYSVGSVIVERA